MESIPHKLEKKDRKINCAMKRKYGKKRKDFDEKAKKREEEKNNYEKKQQSNSKKIQTIASLLQLSHFKPQTIESDSYYFTKQYEQYTNRLFF